MTEREAIDRLESAEQNRDTEVAHCDANDVLCDLLRDLGYAEVVEAYHRVSKWYA